MKRFFAVLAVSALAAIADKGGVDNSWQRQMQQLIGDAAFHYSEYTSAASSFGLLADRVSSVQNWIVSAAKTYARTRGTSGFNLRRVIDLGKGVEILDKGLKFTSMGTDVVSMGSAIRRDNRNDFVDAADSLIRKSCSIIGSAIGVAAASLAGGAVAMAAGPVVAAGVLVGGAVALGHFGGKIAEWMYNDLFGLNLSGQMREAFGTFYDDLLGSPTEKKVPCSSCALGDLTGTCTTPTCPNFGHPHRDYRP